MFWFVLGALVFGFWFGFVIHAVLDSGATEDLIHENLYLKDILKKVAKGEVGLIPKQWLEEE